ncbi:hypothetical protein C9975_11520, partial [Thalassospira xiamenensis]
LHGRDTGEGAGTGSEAGGVSWLVEARDLSGVARSPASLEVAVAWAVSLMVVCGTPGLFGLRQLRDVRFGVGYSAIVAIMLPWSLGGNGAMEALPV